MAATPNRVPDRYFDADPAQRTIARVLYDAVKNIPIISPHGHVDPRLLADPAATLGSPVDLFVIPDHYVFRMLYSRGVQLHDLGISTQDGTPSETDHRRIWQRFADHFYLFRGTPTGLWIADVLANVFGITDKLTSDTAQVIYDQLADLLLQPSFAPRTLFQRFNVAVLCTTDAATSSLDQHQNLHAAGWKQVRPTFRPDALLNLHSPDWSEQITRLGLLANIEIVDYNSFIRAVEARRSYFKQLGATATDHGVITPYTERLSRNEVDRLLARGFAGTATPDDTARFCAHMLLESARMSVEDGLVMQLHAGSFRNHNRPLFDQFGPDMGADIPVHTEWTRNLQPLLNAYGNDVRFQLILFTLDESSYSRELAPLAGHYPAVLLGPPWWFFDSLNGIRRYFDLVMETAGLYNTAGFNDDTRAFASIPARHDLWRRAASNWLAGLVVMGVIDDQDAMDMAYACADGLAKQAYRLPD